MSQLKISHTAHPNTNLTFNEWMIYIYSEVKKLRLPNAQK